jgi:hypothetical protein
MDNLVRITKDITFGDLKSGRKLPIDVYEQQINSWLFNFEAIGQDKESLFEMGMLCLDLSYYFLNHTENIYRAIQLQQMANAFVLGLTHS